MRVLTLHEPWASLVVAGEKRYETRSWRSGWQGTLLIHASANSHFPRHYAFMPPFAPLLQKHPDLRPFRLGCIIGAVQLDGVWLCNPAFRKIATDVTDQEQRLGDFSDGRYAWLLSNPVRFQEPIPCRGWQRLWSPPQELMPEIQRQLREALTP